MNTFVPQWLVVDRPRVSTRVAIAVLRFLTGVLTRLTGCIIRLTTKNPQGRAGTRPTP